MRGPRNKENELSTKITKLGKEIEAPLVYNLTEGNELPVKGETQKEKKIFRINSKKYRMYKGSGTFVFNSTKKYGSIR